MGAPVWLGERCCLKFYEHVLIFPDTNGLTDHSILHYIPIYQVRAKIAVLFTSRDVQIAYCLSVFHVVFPASCLHQYQWALITLLIKLNVM